MDCSPACRPVLSQIVEPAPADRRRKWAVALIGALVLGSVASPAAAAREVSARLVECGDESCLILTGHREDPAATVSINGRAIAVVGERRWRARVPVETVRLWSVPYARTIEVSMDDSKTSTSVDLPIGLLGNVTELAALEVRVR